MSTLATSAGSAIAAHKREINYPGLSAEAFDRAIVDALQAGHIVCYADREQRKAYQFTRSGTPITRQQYNDILASKGNERDQV